MVSPSRIAILGRDASGVASRCRELLTASELRRFPDPFVQFERIQEFGPQLCVVVGSPPEPEVFGLLRLLQERSQSMRILVAIDADSFRRCAALCERLGAQVCVTPVDDTTFLRALLGGEPESADSQDEAERIFHELCNSLSDEINNPLLFIDGYLALLDSRRSESLDRDQRDLLDAARQGIGRIARCLDTLRFAADAHPRRDLTTAADLAELIQEAHDRSDEPVRQRLDQLPDARGLGVLCDRRLAVESLRRLFHLTADLADPESRVVVEAGTDDSHGLLRFSFKSASLSLGSRPELVRTVLGRGALRGSPAALRLAVLDLAMRRHGGRLELVGEGELVRMTAGWPKPEPDADG